jgi:hypothetical protein
MVQSSAISAHHVLSEMSSVRNLVSSLGVQGKSTETKKGFLAGLKLKRCEIWGIGYYVNCLNLQEPRIKETEVNGKRMAALKRASAFQQNIVQLKKTHASSIEKSEGPITNLAIKRTEENQRLEKTANQHKTRER